MAQKLDTLRYHKLYEIVRNLLLAEKDLQRKSAAYWKAENPTRKQETTLMARKERAAEWFGKCELEFEKYIEDHSVNNSFRLTNTDEFMQLLNKECIGKTTVCQDTSEPLKMCKIKKSELVEYSLKDFAEKFNVTQVCFNPFAEWISFEDEDDEQEALENLKYSTVYGGNRFCFDNPADLKRFCKTVENLE